MRVSVIVPTFRRPKDLRACLESLMEQVVLPAEVLVVDNAPEGSAESVVGEFKERSVSRGVDLRYERNSVNSLPVARNRGMDRTVGDIVVFIDDDVVLDRDYLREIERVYATDSNVVGVQGYMSLAARRGLRDWLHRVFYWFHLEYNRCRVLPSVSATYPRDLHALVPCQWMSGANHSYRRSLLEGLRYDEKLLKYADGEDLDLSYRVHQAHAGGLWITPKARCVHLGSMESRTIGRELLRMQEVYGLYLFWKLFDPSFKNKAIYVWSRLGRLMFTLAACARQGFSPIAWRGVLDLLEVYGLCWIFRKRIRAGDLAFFNKTLQ